MKTENDQYEARITERQKDTAFLQAVIAKANLQLNTLAKKKKGDEEGNHADLSDFEKVRELYRHGLATLMRLSEARRMALLSSDQLLQSKRCSAGTFRFGGGRMILGVDRGSDTCRFQSISICRSRSGALKCSRVWAGGEVGRARRRRRSSPRATAQARRSVPSRAVTG